MTLIPIETPEDFLLAEQFVSSHEETCVSLASLVRRKVNTLFFITGSDNFVTEPAKTSIKGIISLDSTIYHCIPDVSKIDINQFDYHTYYN